VQPVGDPLPRHDGRRFARENEKCSLECVLDGVVIAKDSVANAKDHRTMTAQKCFKGSFVMASDEGFEELSVSQPRTVQCQGSPAKVLNDGLHLGGRHLSPSSPSDGFA
jgi:hypothetical protein